MNKPATSDEVSRPGLGLETHFYKSRSREQKVSVTSLLFLDRILQGYGSTSFSLLHLQVINNQTRSNKCQKFEKNQLKKKW